MIASSTDQINDSVGLWLRRDQHSPRPQRVAARYLALSASGVVR